MLVPAEAIDVRVEGVEESRETVQVFTFLAPRAQAFGEEETEVGSRDFVGARVAGVAGDAAAAGGGGGLVFVFAVAAGPFVVPDVEDGACLGGRFGFEGRVDLGPRWSSFLADYFLGFLLFGVWVLGVGGYGCGIICRCEIGGGWWRR